MNDQSKLQNFISNFFNLLMIALSLYLIYLIGHLAWQNYHVDKKVNDLENNVLILELENQSLKDYLEYYKSKTYQELEIRRRFLLKKPGESVVLLPIHKRKQQSIFTSKQPLNTTENQNIIPNYYKWWLYITKGKVDLK